MKSAEQLSDLICCDSVTVWRNLVFKFGKDIGYEQILLGILPNRNNPEAEFTFLHSNFPTDWLNKYAAEKMHHIDPTVAHCASKSIPLIWSPTIFSTRRQKEMYEAACSHGLRSGVTLPIHGAQGELGILSFVTNTKLDNHFQQEARRKLPKLSYLRDIIFETSLRFMKPSTSHEKPPSITPRELECIKWCAAGKSSWEIAKIFHRSESAVNLHFSNLRRKFSVSSRQQVVVKAMRSGLIHL